MHLPKRSGVEVLVKLVGGKMLGMHVFTFSSSTSSEWAQLRTCSVELPSCNAICELSLTSINERADKAGVTLGFSSYTYLEDDGSKREVQLAIGDRVAVVTHRNLIRLDCYMRIYSFDACALLNVYIWDSVA